MGKGTILFIVGLVMLVAGISLSALLTTGWIIIGTIMGVAGGFAMGISTYFLAAWKK